MWSITNSGGFNTSGTFVASGTTGPTLANGNAENLASTGSGGLFGGQGSTYDTTFVNKNNAAVCSVPTGTTTLDCFGPLQVGSSLLLSNAAPTISIGFGTSPSVAASNGTAAFQINVGTGGTASSGVIGFPTSSHGWSVECADVTTVSSSVFITRQTASSATTATVTNYSTSGVATAWTASDKLNCMAFAF